MPFKKVICEDTGAFASKIEEAKSQASNVFVLFTGAGNPSWCGDRRRAHPVIEKVMEESCRQCVGRVSMRSRRYRDKKLLRIV